jgi:hypothetical protein
LGLAVKPNCLLFPAFWPAARAGFLLPLPLRLDAPGLPAVLALLE